MDYTKHFNTQQTKQSEPIPGKKQVKNNAGGFVFQIDEKSQFKRFLILGSEGGSYYASERELTKENAENAIKFIKQAGKEAVDLIVEVSQEGKAPKNDPAIFALALACAFGDEETKQYAYKQIHRVCRIGTHIFLFLDTVKKLRGSSRGLNTGIAAFYENKDWSQLAYQLVKYQQRNGTSHRHVIKLSHPKPIYRKESSIKDVIMRNAMFQWALGKEVNQEHLPMMIQHAININDYSERDVIRAIVNEKIPREIIPTQHLNSLEVWEALLEDMPMTALIRNLGKMTSIGLLGNLKPKTNIVAERLRSREDLKKARIHPLNLLVALNTYSSGKGMKGTLQWNPSSKIVNALEDAFYASFDLIQPTHKNIMLALDVSGSMSFGNCAGVPISPREATACMAMVTARTEANHEIMAFSNRFMKLYIDPRDTLKTVMEKISDLPFQGTDCSLPMLHAIKNNLDVDAFVVYTDNETWAGNIHPSQALKKYRKKSGRNAKLIVVSCQPSRFSIADPSDAGMLDIVGFDTACPQIISEFIRG